MQKWIPVSHLQGTSLFTLLLFSAGWAAAPIPSRRLLDSHFLHLFLADRLLPMVLAIVPRTVPNCSTSSRLRSYTIP